MYSKKAQLIIFSVLIIFTACTKTIEIDKLQQIVGAGNIVSQDIPLTQFQDVELQSNCNVELKSGTEYKASISDYSNLIQYIKLEVVGSKLIIRTEPKNINLSNSKAKAIVYVPSTTLNSLSILGSGNIDLKSEFNNISKVDVLGSGNIKSEVASTTNNLTIAILGSGSIDLLSIQSQSATCNVSGSGNLRLSVSNSLNATISGSGSIFYQGISTSVSSKITGSGKVVKL